MKINVTAASGILGGKIIHSLLTLGVAPGDLTAINIVQLISLVGWAPKNRRYSLLNCEALA